MTSFESELHMFEERDLMLDQQVKNYSEGIGAVAPTGEVPDSELVKAVYESQTDVEDPHVVCIEDRTDVEGQPVREKMAGGNVATGYAAAEMAGWSLFTNTERAADPEVRVDAVASYLEKAGEALGGHTSNHATEENCDCGAAVHLVTAVGIVGEHGHDEQFESQMRDVLGEHFDASTYADVVARAADRFNSGKLSNWSGNFILNAVKRHGGVIEVMDATPTRPELDPSNDRHNHWGEGVAINTVPGKSNNRDAQNIRFFQVDVPAIIRVCQKMAKDEAEFSRLLHSAAAYQFAVRRKLTKNQRNVIV